MFKLIKYHLKHRGHMKIVKILILLAHNPNSPDEDTPNSLSSVQKLSKSCLWTDIALMLKSKMEERLQFIGQHGKGIQKLS